MRLLTVGNRYPPWSLGGYESVWSAAVGELRRRGHEVRVLTTRADPSDLPVGEADPPEVHRELRWYWRDHGFPRLAWREVVALEQENADVLRRHLGEHRPDAVVWWSMGGMSLSLLGHAARAGVASVGVVADEWMSYGPVVDHWTRHWRGARRPLAGLAERRYSIPARLDLDGSGQWVFIAPHLLELARADGWRLPGAAVLAPGVDPTRFRWRGPAAAWAGELLVLGRVDPRKGIDTAIRALGELPDARLRVDGPGEVSVRAELATLVEELGVEGQVRFAVSEHDAVPEVIAAADAVIFPVKWREPWGLVPLEAMATGRPVIATRAGGGPDRYLRAEVNCLQFEPGDVAGLAACVRRLSADPGLRARLVQGGRETAARYSEAAFHDGLERRLVALAGAHS